MIHPDLYYAHAPIQFDLLSSYLFSSMEQSSTGDSSAELFILKQSKYLVLKELYQLEYFERPLRGSSAGWFLTEMSNWEGGSEGVYLLKLTACFYSYCSSGGNKD